MKRNIVISICSALILLTLQGCRLARETAGEDGYEDRLVGIFVTTDYLDAEDRLYATLTAAEEYVFEDVEGICYFAPTIPAAAQRDSYISSMWDEGISDGHLDVSIGEEEESTTLEGTLYVTPSFKNHTLHFNPVYQSAKGDIYTTAGSGFEVNHDSDSEDSSFSQTLDATTTLTENGRIRTDSISITLSVSIMFTPEKIVVLQMDTDSGLISRTEYAPDALPETFLLDTSTNYIIVETHKRDDTGALIISRGIYGKDDETADTFAAREDGICVKHQTPIQWPQ